jgi:hypothetical protein
MSNPCIPYLSLLYQTHTHTSARAPESVEVAWGEGGRGGREEEEGGRRERRRRRV